MVPANPTLPPRITALVRLLASNHDAEALAAARGLQRALRAIGSDLNGLADQLEARPAEVEQAKPAPFFWRAADRGPRWADLGDLDRAELLDYLKRLPGLTDWQSGFLFSLVQLSPSRLRSLSTKQVTALDRLIAKVFGQGAGRKGGR